MESIDDAAITELIEQGLSQRAIAEQLNISRSTLRRYLEKRKGTPEVHSTVHLALPHAPTERVAEVDTSTRYVELPSDLVALLQEILPWWRERRRLTETPLRSEEETQRQTYHIEKRYIEAIKRAADLERVSITEIVNRAFYQYFSKK